MTDKEQFLRLARQGMAKYPKVLAALAEAERAELSPEDRERINIYRAACDKADQRGD